jgi:hypothetical protein
MNPIVGSAFATVLVLALGALSALPAAAITCVPAAVKEFIEPSEEDVDLFTGTVASISAKGYRVTVHDWYHGPGAAPLRPPGPGERLA